MQGDLTGESIPRTVVGNVKKTGRLGVEITPRRSEVGPFLGGGEL